jgi:hypothetical protein
MFNTRLDPNGGPKQDETNGNDHHVLENGEQSKIGRVSGEAIVVPYRYPYLVCRIRYREKKNWPFRKIFTATCSS